MVTFGHIFEEVTMWVLRGRAVQKDVQMSRGGEGVLEPCLAPVRSSPGARCVISVEGERQ